MDYEDVKEAQTDDIARAWVNARIFRKVDESGRMEVVIMNTGSKMLVDHFFAEPGEDGQDIITGISALRSLAGERITEKALIDPAQYNFQRGKTIVFNTLTRDMELRIE